MPVIKLIRIHLVLGIALLSSSAYALNVDQVVNRLQTSYESVKTIQANFVQIYHSSRFGDQKASGQVTIAKPGKMRWNYDEPKGKTLLMDGQQITLFDPLDQQVLIGKQPKDDDLPVALSFLWGKGRLTELFNVSIESKQAKQVVLKCVPKEPIPNTSEVYLTLSMEKRVLVQASRIRDGFGGENEIQFSKMRVNRTLKATEFKFTPPKGVPVVSLNMSEIKL